MYTCKKYSQNSLSGHSRKQTTLLMAALTKPSLNSIAHTNSVFTHSSKWPAPVADTFSASKGCPLTGALTVVQNLYLQALHDYKKEKKEQTNSQTNERPN